MGSSFHTGGKSRLRRALRDQARAEVNRELEPVLQAAPWWRRPFLLVRMRREIARRTEERMPREALFARADSMGAASHARVRPPQAKFCCGAFDHLLDNAGERSLSVVVGRDAYGVHFSLQGRAVEANADLSGLRGSGDLPGGPKYCTLACSMRIRFCPSCGAKLEKVFRKRQNELEELIRKHEKVGDLAKI